jgi:hypothetical protein
MMHYALLAYVVVVVNSARVHALTYKQLLLNNDYTADTCHTLLVYLTLHF